MALVKMLTLTSCDSNLPSWVGSSETLTSSGAEMEMTGLILALSTWVSSFEALAFWAKISETAKANAIASRFVEDGWAGWAEFGWTGWAGCAGWIGWAGIGWRPADWKRPLTILNSKSSTEDSFSSLLLLSKISYLNSSALCFSAFLAASSACFFCIASSWAACSCCSSMTRVCSAAAEAAREIIEALARSVPFCAEAAESPVTTGESSSGITVLNSFLNATFFPFWYWNSYFLSSPIKLKPSHGNNKVRIWMEVGVANAFGKRKLNMANGTRPTIGR